MRDVDAYAYLRDSRNVIMFDANVAAVHGNQVDLGGGPNNVRVLDMTGVVVGSMVLVLSDGARLIALGAYS